MSDERPAWVTEITDALKTRFRPSDDDDDDVLDGMKGTFKRRLERALSQRDRAVGERDKALEVLEAVPTRFDEIEAAAAKRVQDMQEEAGKALTAARTEWSGDMKLHEAGVPTPLGRKAVRDAWAALPKDQQGEGPVKWWESVREAQGKHLADPKGAEAPTVPPHLSVYLPAEPTKKGADGTPRLPPRGPADGPRDLGAQLDAIPDDVGMDGFLSELAKMDAQARQ